MTDKTTLKFDPLGLQERSFLMMERGMSVWAQACGQAMGQGTQAFGKAVGDPIGEAYARKIDETPMTPQELGEATMQAQQQAMTEVGQLWARNMNLMVRSPFNPMSTWLGIMGGTAPSSDNDPEPGE